MTWVVGEANLPQLLAQDVWPVLDSGRCVAKKFLRWLRIHKYKLRQHVLLGAPPFREAPALRNLAIVQDIAS